MKVSDQAKLRRAAEAYGSTMQWPLEVDDGGGVGPERPYHRTTAVRGVRAHPTTVVGLPGIAGTEEGVGSAGSFNPTRWRF